MMMICFEFNDNFASDCWMICQSHSTQPFTLISLQSFISFERFVIQNYVGNEQF